MPMCPRVNRPWFRGHFRLAAYGRFLPVTTGETCELVKRRSNRPFVSPGSVDVLLRTAAIRET
jgi:hypothetical protein